MKTITLAAIAAVASQALAEPVPKPYRPIKAFLSAREIFGLEGRGNDVYHPKQSICGAGTTCANSCGDEYEQCPSTDNQMHCFNVKLNESCCTDGTGNSCEAGYYCAADTSSKTWCCPEGMDVDTCASTYQVTGSLTSDAPYVSSTTSSSSTSSTSSTLVASSSATTSSTSTRISSQTSSAVSSHASSTSSGPSPLMTGAVFFETGNSTATGVAAGSGARVGTGATATVSSQESATSAASADSSATSGVSTSGASSASPATFLALFAAAALAALF